MSKLIGTSPNQVPSNADLGTAAFMDATDFLTSRGSSLSAVNAVIPKTAVDVFIYDTSKDSDGGAWRKRTKNTSWYNERLNTTTRSSRREFPAVAVIILTNTNVVIYDGDDPTLPMWMEFTIYYSNYSQGSGILGGVYGGANENKTATGIAMMNGQMWMTRLGAYNGAANYGAAVFVDFLQDLGGALGDAFGNGVTVKNPTFLGNIAQRNSSAFSGHGQYKYWSAGIVNDQCKDVAMTVLPNAPIDSATGLPVPTIAVATNGGVSLIKDNGNVFDGNETGAYKTVVFVEDRIVSDRNQGQSRYFISPPVPSISSDGWINADAYIGGWTGSSGYPSTHLDAIPGFMEKAGISFSVKGDNKGLTFWDWKKDTGVNAAIHPTSAVAYVSSDYNTGWMQGDIKLATLSDTDTADISFSNKQLIDEPYFNSSTGWYFNGATGPNGAAASVGSGWTLSGGKITMSNGGGDVYAVIPVVNGVQYVMQLTFDTTGNSAVTSNVSWGFRSLANSGYISESQNQTILANDTAGQTKQIFWTANTTGYVLTRCYCDENLSIDNWTIFIAEEDRSVNGNGVQVYGTIKKTPVAAGADLVAYDGFSDSNYLMQPYNSDLDFADDFNITFWYYHVDVAQNEYIVFRAPFDNGTPKTEIYLNPGNQIGCYISDMGGINVNNLPENVWHHISVVRESGTVRFYVNGEQKVTGSSSIDLTNTSAILSIGKRTAGSYYGINGKLALFRMSATAPSAEQVKKIYEDEKLLFQDNAKCTLHGTSDAVTALAYDNDTETLHVGTSDGRSDFQGLRRVNNTTRAVSTAISAVDGFIVEE